VKQKASAIIQMRLRLKANRGASIDEQPSQISIKHGCHVASRSGRRVCA
jgi:hypothetical protein